MWGAARVVDDAHPAGASARLLERTFQERIFSVEDVETPFPMRISSIRSGADLRDPEILVLQAIELLEFQRKRREL